MKIRLKTCLVLLLLYVGSALSQIGGRPGRGRGGRAAQLPQPIPGAVATHKEWVELVRREVERLHRLPRSMPAYEDETASRIYDLKEHYRVAFEQVKEVATDQDSRREETREMLVNGRFIVFMSDSTSDRDLNKVMRVLRTYSKKDTSGRFIANHFSPIRHVGKGFTATLSPSVVRVLRRHPATYTVENDVVLQRSSRYSFDDLDNLDEVFAQAEEEEELGVESRGEVGAQSVEWNLDRIDQHSLPLDSKSFSPKGNGDGIDVYVLDTGIRYTHNEFNGRAKYAGYDAIDALVSSSSKKGADCNGHGTHCAATIGGKTFGVAKSVNLYSSRVLDCTGTGSVSGIINAMNQIIGARKAAGKGSKTCVFSMSLGVKKSAGFNSAINAAVKSGAVVVSASGNQMGDSCLYSPGSATLSISVAATDQSDDSTSFSNIGRCTDIYAPGYGIHSANSGCDSCTTTKSGTSMACPHVAGYAAVLLGLNPTFTPAQVKTQVIADSTKGKIKFSDRPSLSALTPNRLLYVGK